MLDASWLIAYITDYFLFCQLHQIRRAMLLVRNPLSWPFEGCLELQCLALWEVICLEWAEVGVQ